MKLRYFKCILAKLNSILAKGHSYRSQGHRPWWMNRGESFWPTAIFKLQALQLNMAVGQSLTSFFRTRGVAPGYVEKGRWPKIKNSRTSKLAPSAQFLSARLSGDL